MRTYDTRPMSRPPADSAAHSPFVLDATVLAHGGLTWEHEFRDVPFARLHGLALSVTPTVQATLRFGLSEQRPVVKGRLETELELTCQRCMQPMRQAVAEEFELMLVNSEATTPTERVTACLSRSTAAFASVIAFLRSRSFWLNSSHWSPNFARAGGTFPPLAVASL